MPVGVYKRTAAHRLAISLAGLGKKLTEAHKAAIGRGVRRRFKRTPYVMSKKGARNIVKAVRKFYADGGEPWNKGKKISAKQNPWNKPSHRRKMSNLRKQEWKMTKVRRNQRKARIKSWRNPSEKMLLSHAAKLKRISGKRISDIQRKLWWLLRPRGFKLEYQVGRYAIDIAHPSKKIAIEVDGYFFHFSAEQKRKDRAKDKFLKSLGWQVIRVSTKDMNAFMKSLKGRGELPLQ
jgi:very-short-patch-repair endonuclease